MAQAEQILHSVSFARRSSFDFSEVPLEQFELRDPKKPRQAEWSETSCEARNVHLGVQFI